MSADKEWERQNAVSLRQQEEWSRHEVAMAEIERDYSEAKAEEFRDYAETLKGLQAELDGEPGN